MSSNSTRGAISTRVTHTKIWQSNQVTLVISPRVSCSSNEQSPELISKDINKDRVISCPQIWEYATFPATFALVSPKHGKEIYAGMQTTELSPNRDPSL